MSGDYVTVEIKVERSLAEKIVSDGHTAVDMSLMFGLEVVEKIAEVLEDE